MKFPLFTAVLFSVWMNAADGQDRHPAICCLTVSNTRIQVKYIVDYTIQESTGTCPIRAVRFLTKKGKYICSDPDNCWAIRAINDVSCRKNKAPYKETTMCNTSTTKCGTGGPAASLTETTPGQDTDQTTTSRTTNTETTSTETTTATPTTVTTITTTQTSTREIKSISATANKASSDVDGRSSFTVITVQTTADPENSRTIPEMDMRITTAAQIIDTTPPLTTFKEPELEVAASTEDCCLTVTENRAAIHEIEETPAEDWDYMQNLNGRTTEQTDKREFIRKTKALEQNRVRSAETTDTLQLDGFSEESSSSEINHPYTNNEYKKEPVQYFCIKQP